jgi:hypothetical protein
MMAYACNPSTQEVEAGGSKVQANHGLHSEFQSSLSNLMRACLKRPVTRDIAQWYHACLACSRPWVWSPALQRNNNNKKIRIMDLLRLWMIRTKLPGFARIGNITLGK